VQCIPVFLPVELGSQFEDLCHEVLKPIFHFVHPMSGALSRSFDRSSTSWQLYCEVNNYYVTPVVEHSNEGDFVFVFDPELLMAPNLLGKVPDRTGPGPSIELLMAPDLFGKVFPCAYDLTWGERLSLCPT
jgi:trehalose-6-phosphate synthase